MILFIKDNYKSNYVNEGEVYYGEKGVPKVEVLGNEFTSLLVLIGIYFPSVTGNLKIDSIFNVFQIKESKCYCLK